MGKVFRLEELKKILQKKKKQKKEIVFTNGCFDLLHIGHVRYLKKAKSLGNLLVVGVNGDQSVKILKGKGRPINSENFRAEILSALEFVDYVLLFNEETPMRVIKTLNPDILVKGGDWKVKDIVGSDYVLSYGGKVYSLPFVKGFSSSDLIQKIENSSRAFPADSNDTLL